MNILLSKKRKKNQIHASNVLHGRKISSALFWLFLGPPGLPGLKGNKGIEGSTGSCGNNGLQGCAGPPGKKKSLKTSQMRDLIPLTVSLTLSLLLACSRS